MQVSAVNTQSAAAKAAAQSGLLGALVAIGKSEGIGGYWRGNIPQARLACGTQRHTRDSRARPPRVQVIRVLPYSACQLYSYEKLKKLFADKEGRLSVPARLAAGAGAACVSTVLTYPLDIIRFRMAVDPTLNTIPQVVRAVLRDEGLRAFYKGLLPSCVGIAPYASINFAAFDLLKKALPDDAAGNSTAVFVCSLAAAALATGGCYPLDTIRRQMQLKSSTHANVWVAAQAIVARDGVLGLYRGFLPNAAKNLPNSSIRLSTFDAAKRLLGAANREVDEEASLVASSQLDKKR